MLKGNGIYKKSLRGLKQHFINQNLVFPMIQTRFQLLCAVVVQFINQLFII